MGSGKFWRHIISKYLTAYLNITRAIALEVLQNEVKYLFQKKHFKKLITQYFLVVNESPCFLVELSKQNFLQLNMSKNIEALRNRH